MLIRRQARATSRSVNNIISRILPFSTDLAKIFCGPFPQVGLTPGSRDLYDFRDPICTDLIVMFRCYRTEISFKMLFALSESLHLLVDSHST